MFLSTILESVGATPMVKLNRVGSRLKCNLFAKCEFFNPGGSVKDRIGLRMVEDAEKAGRIKPGDTLIEATSGNTGIGLALAGAVKGYRVIIAMPEKMSREKQVVIEALGAEIIRTPTEAAHDSPESNFGVAKKLQKELPNAHILDQWTNQSNPTAHYEGTGKEIYEQLDGKVDMVVMGAGTGGTITGVAKYLKEKNPACKIIGADPIGSIIGGGDYIGTYKVEGIGYDFIPEVCHVDLVDTWVKTADREAFLLARRLIKEEGLLCGGSSGSALYAALKEAALLKEGQNCVVILPDGVRNYMTKFVDDRWMTDQRFFAIDGLEGNVGQLLDSKPALVSLEQSGSIKDAIHILKEKGIDQIPVTEDGVLCGIVSEDCLLNAISSGVGLDTSLGEVMDRAVPTALESTPISALQEILAKERCAIVIDDSRKPQHIVTKIDLVDYLSTLAG